MKEREIAQHQVKKILKSGTLAMLDLFGMARLFRYLNRDKLLVVMYHGVTATNYDFPIWTQLPVEVFRRQLAFLKKRYSVVTLDQVLSAVEGRGTLPERAALITFDDGIRNNYSVAFPVLREMGLPASIFLTMDLVGTREILWFDELYLLIQEGGRRRIPLTLLGETAGELYRAGDLAGAYLDCVESVKRTGPATREAMLSDLRRAVPLQREAWLEDFGLLTWDQVDVMQRCGLVKFGVHTATHRILTELAESELEYEVQVQRARLAERLGVQVDSFCFPNGRPGLDFLPRHQEFLRCCGYRLAFTTQNGLFDWRQGEALGIGRVPAGNDSTSDPAYFSLNTSGAVTFLCSLAGGGIP